MTYKLDINANNGQTSRWWMNFLSALPEGTILEDWMLEQGVSPEFLQGLFSYATIYHLEFVSDQARTMFVLKYS